MNQQYQQLDPKTIETLKAARNQVIPKPQSDRDPGATRLGVQVDNGAGKSGGENNKLAPLENRNKELKGQQLSKHIADKFLTGFAEEFIQKLASIEQKTAAVDKEMAKVEKFWASLVEKKKQLEARRNELIKVKDKLKELDKEMSDVLKSQ